MFVDMKIAEIVCEGRQGKLAKSHKRALHRTHVFGDGHKANGNMNFYRVAMASAMADGTNKSLPIDERTWYSTNNVAVPYSEIEHHMLRQAYKAVKTDVKQPVKHHGSKESKMVNSVSPVAKVKRNQYGV